LIQWSNEEDWIKSMYIEYITYNFSIAIRPSMFMIHETLPKKRKIEKIMQCPFIKSLPL
jgi:hypothetical protein